MRSVLATMFIVAAAFVAAPAAHALVVTETSTVAREFHGAGCGSTDSASVTLPAGARTPRLVQPALGQILPHSEDDVTPVARITSRGLSRVGSRWVASFTATGSDDACANPQNYSEGWFATDVDLITRYRRRVRVYVSGATRSLAQRRPRRLLFGANGYLARLRWSSWDGSVARGRGAFPYRACRPNCAQGSVTLYPVAVRLSRPRLCADRYRYLTLRYRFTGRVPPHTRRSQALRFDFVC